jgi:two-component system chemotaxis sensor kinase CheA
VAKDPFRYFRIEARELIDGLAQGMLALEKDGGAEAVNRLLRLAHTLKGAARVVRQGGIADGAHAFEELLMPLRAESRAAAAPEIDACLALVDGMRAALGALEQARPAGEGAAAPAAQEIARAVRVDSGEADALVEGMAGAGRDLAELSRELDALDEARELAQSLAAFLDPDRRQRGEDAIARAGGQAAMLCERLARSQRELARRVERLQRQVVELRSRGERMRLQPASLLFGPLERALRDAGRELDRRVRWEAAGGDIGIDTAALAALAEALPHVVRNAVVHGIEAPTVRLAAGKPAEGCVSVRCARVANQVSIAISDDGGGIDFGAIRALALKRGLAGAPRPGDEAALSALLLRGGLSTSPTVTGVAGRGVGLDAVRATVEGLRGTLTLTSQPRQGTTLEVLVPASLASAPSLIVQAGGSVVAIPLDAVASTARVPAADVVRTSAGEALVLGERTVPVLELALLVGAAAGAPARRAHRTVVVLRAHGLEAALEVDRLAGTAEVSVRPFPPGVRPVPALAGAGVDDAGAPRLVLDAAAAINEVRAAVPAAAAPEPAVAPTSPILVVDDSLTTRTLEQSILESAGYEVDIAVSAEQALELAERRRYGLFVVDVEMPGMDGFEFVRRTREHPRHRQVPAILVTSRASAEDRRRGAEAGASAYIIKAEFDQVHLLQLIRGLIG